MGSRGYDYVEINETDPDVYHLNPWIAFTNKIIYKKNGALFGVTTGQQGSGKSYSNLAYAIQLDPDFQLQENWYFNALKMFKDIQKYYAKDGPRKKAKKWFYDEAGIDLNNQNWYDSINKGYNRLFQTQRHRNPVLMTNVPFLTLLSTGVRKLLNTRWYAEGVIDSENKTIVRPRTMQYNDDLDKIYYKRLVVRMNHKLCFCSIVKFPKPPTKILNEYEKLKDEFSSDMMEDTVNELTALEDKKGIHKQKMIMYSYQQENILDMLKKGFNVDKIAEIEDLTKPCIYDHIKALRSKGVAIMPVKEDGGIKVSKFMVIDKRSPEQLKKVAILLQQNQEATPSA